MDAFWKAAAGILLTAILALAVGKQEKDMAILLTLAACAMGAMLAVSWLEPVLDLMWELSRIGKLEEDWLQVILNAVGIALISEITAGLCADAGYGALGKTIQMLSSAAIFSLSVPLIRMLIALVGDVLGML